MSCFPEWTYALYVDGELPRDEMRRLEAHLVGCRNCRVLVVGLREEARLLGDVLRGEEPQSLQRPDTTPPARGLAIGVVPSLVLAGIVAAVVGALLETRLPTSIAWLNPMRLMGAYDMVLGFIFLLRDEIPGLLEFLIAVTATVSVAALATFSVTVLVRRFAGPSVLALLCLALVSAPQDAAAFDVRHAEAIHVARNEVVDGTLVVSAQTVRVDGVVTGDLIVLAERLTLRGEVRGDLFSVTRSLELDGVVSGSLHAFGERTRLGGRVGGNAYTASEDFTLSRDARIGRDALPLAGGAVVDGAVARDLFVIGEWAEVRGSVGRDLQARVGRLTLLDTARVGADVDAYLYDSKEVEMAPGAQVDGEARTRFPDERHRARLARYRHAHFYLVRGILLAAGFLVGMLFYLMAPAMFAARLETTGAFFRSLGIGFLALVATPLALAPAAVTLVGIPVTLIVGADYLLALYLSPILVAALVGRTLISSDGEGASGFGLALLVGLLVLTLLVNVPVLGWLVRVLAVLTGLGILVERAVSAWRASHPARE
jgi:cytoskeletal protein CcmA (bactofilin family)